MDARKVLQKMIDETRENIDSIMQKEYERYEHLFLKEYEYYGKVYTVTELKLQRYVTDDLQSTYEDGVLIHSRNYKNIYTVILRHDFLEWKEVDANDLLDGKITEVTNYEQGF